MLRKIRSFVRRDGRMTEAQRLAFTHLWPQFGLSEKNGLLSFATLFQREAPLVFEIGFGSGQSLLVAAKQHPDWNFIGVEMHKPGIGALLLHMHEQQVSNIRIFYADAVEVLENAIADASLDIVQIFFPDPWQKRKHHKRRLIQPVFVEKLANKLKPNGILYLATDWEDYAMQMMRVLSAEKKLINTAGTGKFASRSEQRPIATKFEKRGERSGRAIWELCFYNTIRVDAEVSSLYNEQQDGIT